MVYLGLGTNLGDRRRQLRTAVREIEEQIGAVTVLSAFYATEPWGFSSSHTFLNAAAGVETTLPPLAILEATQAIECRMGRVRKSANGCYTDRPIDIDLLLCGDMVVDTPVLSLPHPLMHLRAFVMQPLAEIAPEAVHPLLGKTVDEIWHELEEADTAVWQRPVPPKV